MTTHEQALLHAICQDPFDNFLRLVYADWLEENNQEQRAGFIRVQIELSKRPPAKDLKVRRLEHKYEPKLDLGNTPVWFLQQSDYLVTAYVHEYYMEGIEVGGLVRIGPSHGSGYVGYFFVEEITYNTCMKPFGSNVAEVRLKNDRVYNEINWHELEQREQELWWAAYLRGDVSYLLDTIPHFETIRDKVEFGGSAGNRWIRFAIREGREGDSEFARNYATCHWQRGFLYKLAGITLPQWEKYGPELVKRIPLVEVEMAYKRTLVVPTSDNSFYPNSYAFRLRLFTADEDHTLPIWMAKYLNPTKSWGYEAIDMVQNAYYNTEQEALRDLSNACINWARQQVGLKPLPPKPQLPSWFAS